MTSVRKPRSAEWQRPLLLIAVCGALSAPVLAESAGTVTNLAGVLSARKADGAVKVLGPKSEVDRGDLLSTGAGTYARVKFTDGGELTLRPNTQIKIDDYRFEQARPEEDNAFFRLIKGGLRAVTGLVGKRNGVNAYRMNTPTATIGIRGTNYGVLYCEPDAREDDCADYRDQSGQSIGAGLHLDVAEGRIVVDNEGGQQEYKAGEFGFVGSKSSAPMSVAPGKGVPIATDLGTNQPPESVLGNPLDPQDFACTIN